MRRRRIYAYTPRYPPRTKTTRGVYDPPPAPLAGYSTRHKGSGVKARSARSTYPSTGWIGKATGCRYHGPIQARGTSCGESSDSPSGRRGDLRPAAGPASFCEGAVQRRESYRYRAPPAAPPRI